MQVKQNGNSKQKNYIQNERNILHERKLYRTKIGLTAHFEVLKRKREMQNDKLFAAKNSNENKQKGARFLLLLHNLLIAYW
jgi:hypothetical protein